MSDVLVQPVQARLIVRTTAALPLTAVLRYDRADPLAIHASFPAESSLDGAEVDWVFARELLRAGLHAPAGDGDVRLWPGGRVHTMLELHTPEGMALVELRRAELRYFLRRCDAAVPRGQEDLGGDLDSGLAALLGGV
ncbi:SsgA family sporulation/cell division regulator [Streptomyces oceani]|uniref:SsgD protein n=1 Tax=Streptomyces oceani TaxID=1075402 RepID=A0A1E7KMX4_9ACTN|nr:SsgA family sporulation/cell division regulator [Streptomyces oceani]OEV05253.1 hypothetical protein AN216_03820 [Streptomyces oceani]